MKGGGRPTCPAAGEDAEEDRGPAAEGERGLLGGERRNRTRRLYPQNAWSIPSARATLNLDERY